ncbi:beta-1,4-mannosyltransferase [Nematocida sp. LUAm3]|nr:beta-1,4-mannosyltransferase [Nematocida sp. LUAm3]KAI5174110.1 beta-1,4-mannosyltransferase [Nematocida sp. LUAm2]KAI5177147.1 beta-1,4-mannosyltransferase [Nematocida sp. LUAm1]
MLVINAAPLDQSGRSNMLAEYFSSDAANSTIVTYPGIRKGPILSKNVDVVQMRNISTKNYYPLIQGLLLIIKFFYLNLIICYHIFIYSQKNKSELEKNKNMVILVTPPFSIIYLPLLLCTILSLDAYIDWHRAENIKYPLLLAAKLHHNFVVTDAMKKYFNYIGIKKVHKITDAFLTEKLSQNRKAVAKLPKKELFVYLSKKYPEYAESFLSIDFRQKLGVCSTSCSPEEDIPGFLNTLNDLSLSTKGTIIITTKEKIRYTHPTVNVFSVFLDHEDYLSLLEVMHFGISTHSCEKDFPLKIMDYLHANILVLAHPSTPQVSEHFSGKIRRYKNKNDFIKKLNFYLRTNNK